MLLQNQNASMEPSYSPVTETHGESLAPSLIIRRSRPYALAWGPAAVRRLQLLHNIYAPAGRRVLLEAGLKEGMRVADFGCGVGVATRMLAEIVGPSGTVVGIDIDKAQIEEAARWCGDTGL
jgi:SAM-dependent methyltransferase